MKELQNGGMGFQLPTESSRNQKRNSLENILSCFFQQQGALLGFSPTLSERPGPEGGSWLEFGCVQFLVVLETTP